MSKNNTQFSKEYIIVSIIIIIGFVLRLYKITNPLADWHSWRQADTSAVTRRYVQEGIDLLQPKYDDISSIPSGIDNPSGYRFVEFPFINALTALAIQKIPDTGIEIWGRLISILFSLGSILAVYEIAKWYFSKSVGFISAAVFAILPYNLYYHRTILPEVPMVFFALFGYYFFLRWLKNEDKLDFLSSVIITSLGVLLKPYILFLALPLGYEAVRKWRASVVKQFSLYIFLVLILIPFIIWRMWASQFPEGIPAYEWLLNGSGIRFRPAFFRWIFAERIGKLILGYWLLIPFGLGIVKRPTKKSGWALHWWLLAILLYLVTFATGNVTHDYYQIIIVPPIAIAVGVGIDFLISSKSREIHRLVGILLCILVLGFGLGFSWFYIRDFYNINHPEIVAAGEAANFILPPDAKVIAPYGGDTAFLYQINRLGWPIGGDIQSKIEKGATDYITVNFDEEAKLLSEKCQPAITVEETTIISLRNCNL